MQYSLTGLSPGRHTLMCKVTDVAENTVTKSCKFRIKQNRDCEMETPDSEDNSGDEF